MFILLVLSFLVYCVVLASYRHNQTQNEITLDVPEGGEDEAHYPTIIDELAACDPDVIEKYGENVLAGKADPEVLMKALPCILQTLRADDCLSTTRRRVRDVLKKIYMAPLRMEGTVKYDLYQAIGDISTLI